MEGKQKFLDIYKEMKNKSQKSEIDQRILKNS